jgi:hypothetical protein
MPRPMKNVSSSRTTPGGGFRLYSEITRPKRSRPLPDAVPKSRLMAGLWSDDGEFATGEPDALAREPIVNLQLDSVLRRRDRNHREQ